MAEGASASPTDSTAAYIPFAELCHGEKTGYSDNLVDLRTKSIVERIDALIANM